MRIGIAGAHRVGKTTLCKVIANHPHNNIDCRFIPTNVGKVWEKCKNRPSQYKGFEVNLAIHKAILLHCKDLWNGECDFITDRTPLDFMAYVLSSIDLETYAFNAPLETFFSSCFSSIYENFDVIFILQPGIKYVHKDGIFDTEENALPYINHIDFLIKGLAADSRVTTDVIQINRETLDLEERATELMVFLRDCGAWKWQKSAK